LLECGDAHGQKILTSYRSGKKRRGMMAMLFAFRHIK
jgi:hypothetical protein